jgi:glycosyltransferase involved in cell wall biosynthesis
LDLLLKSAKIVREVNPEVSFVMVGGNPQQVTHWRNEAKIHGLEDCMLFTGSLPLAEAAAYLDMAEILVSPRLGGTSVPLKIYSYLSSGKPIVATNLAPHTQVLNDEIALLVAPTGEAFANGILALVRSPDLRRRLGHRAQQFAQERFGYADYLAKVDKVYQEFLPSACPGEEAPQTLQPDPGCSGKGSCPPSPQDIGS